MRPCLAALLVGLTACSVFAPTRPSVNLGTEFRLAPGESATLSGTTLRVHFDHVVEDSRCPAGVTCVWEGDAVVAVLAREGAEPERRHDLHTQAAGNATTHGAYRIRLVRLDPYPTSAGPVAARDYCAVLVVTRVDGSSRVGV